MRESFRKCPNCGRRFRARLLQKRLVSTERGTEQITTNPVALNVQGGPGIISDGAFQVGVTIRRDEYEQTFECRSCHHRWTERVARVE